MKRLAPALLLVAATATAAPPPDAKRFVERQLDGSDAARGSMAEDAFLVLPETARLGPAEPPGHESDGFLIVNDVMPEADKLGKLTAGRLGEVTWIAAEIAQTYGLLDCPQPLARCHRKRTLRISQLVVGGKAVVVHVDDPKHAPTDAEATAIEPGTTAGPLTALLTDPKAMAGALLADPSVVVLGTELAERAVGPAAAKKKLGSWARLSLSLAGKPHEVRTPTWGYAAANVDWKARGKTVHMRATVFAVDVDGAWKVVLVHYSVPFHRTD